MNLLASHHSDDGPLSPVPTLCLWSGAPPLTAPPSAGVSVGARPDTAGGGVHGVAQGPPGTPAWPADWVLPTGRLPHRHVRSAPPPPPLAPVTPRLLDIRSRHPSRSTPVKKPCRPARLPARRPPVHPRWRDPSTSRHEPAQMRCGTCPRRPRGQARRCWGRAGAVAAA